MRKRFVTARPVATVALMLVLSPSAFAQRPTADIRGTVTDQTGAVVLGAEVIVRNVATDQTSTVTTNDEGVYSVLNLTPGPYEITINASSFKKQIVTDVELSAVPHQAQPVGLCRAGRRAARIG
jgi:hypothetical protein